MSKVLWTSADIAKAVSGEANGDFTVSGFIPMAMEKGAGGTLSENPVSGNAVIVKDSLQALRDLGKEGVER